MFTNLGINKRSQKIQFANENSLKFLNFLILTILYNENFMPCTVHDMDSLALKTIQKFAELKTNTQVNHI